MAGFVPHVAEQRAVALVEPAAAAGGEDAHVRPVDRQRARQGIRAAERSVAAILLGKQRRDGHVGGRGGSCRDTAADGRATLQAILDAEARRRGVVVVLEQHAVGGTSLEVHGQRPERLLPPDPGVVEGDEGVREAAVADPHLHLRRMHDPRLHLLRGEGAGGELGGEQRVHRSSRRGAERIVGGEGEPRAAGLEHGVGVVVLEVQRRQEARADLPPR